MATIRSFFSSVFSPLYQWFFRSFQCAFDSLINAALTHVHILNENMHINAVHILIKATHASFFELRYVFLTYLGPKIYRKCL